MADGGENGIASFFRAVSAGTNNPVSPSASRSFPSPPSSASLSSRMDSTTDVGGWPGVGMRPLSATARPRVRRRRAERVDERRRQGRRQATNTPSGRRVGLWAGVRWRCACATCGRRNLFHHLVSCDDADDVVAQAESQTEGPTTDGRLEDEGRRTVSSLDVQFYFPSSLKGKRSQVVRWEG